MNVIINGYATPGDGGGESGIVMEYGDISMETFTLRQLSELTRTEPVDHKVAVYHLNSDQQHRYDATGVATVQYEVDKYCDRVFMLDTVIDGPFLYTLSIGDKFKAFHCENCAKEFVDFFIARQPIWKETYHGSLRLSAPTPKKSYQ